MLIELRWHSRGGLGALTSARVLAEAVWEFGYWAQASPEYGPERAGAPMMCYDRLSTQKISLHCGIYEPAIVAVLDPALLATIPVTEGLKPSGILVVNTDTPAPKSCSALASRSRQQGVVDTVSSRWMQQQLPRRANASRRIVLCLTAPSSVPFWNAGWSTARGDRASLLS